MPEKINHSLYESAPGLILDRLAEVNDVLQKQKAKTGETDSWKFWMKVSETMLFAWEYIQDLKFITKRNQLLEHENAWLRAYNIDLIQRLEPFELIRVQMLTEKLEENVKVVERLILQEDKEIRHLDNNKENA